jgi:hypothetical protein
LVCPEIELMNPGRLLACRSTWCWPRRLEDEFPDRAGVDDLGGTAVPIDLIIAKVRRALPTSTVRVRMLNDVADRADTPSDRPL